jgi:group I intron endonuclease
MVEKQIKIGVYKIIFPDGQFYIGSAYGIKGFEGRWDKHRKGHRSSPKYLQELVQNYGGWSCAVFLILRETKTEQRALLCEQAYINRNKNDSMLLNHNKDVWRPPDMRGENNPIFGKHLSEEHKKKIGEGNKGKKLSEETKKKLSEANKGKHHSEETKRKMSLASKGKLKSEKTRQRMSAAQRGENHSQAKLTWIQVKEIREKYKIVDENGKKKFFQRQIAEEYNISQSLVHLITSNRYWKEEITTTINSIQNQKIQIGEK